APACGSYVCVWRRGPRARPAAAAAHAHAAAGAAGAPRRDLAEFARAVAVKQEGAEHAVLDDDVAARREAFAVKGARARTARHERIVDHRDELARAAPTLTGGEVAGAP